MILKYHIPTEQYGFIEVELEGVLESGEPIYTYEKVKEMFNVKEGLSEKDFRVALDRYLTKGDMDSEAYAEMNEKQKDVIQCIKRANKRIKAHEDDDKPPF